MDSQTDRQQGSNIFTGGKSISSEMTGDGGGGGDRDPGRYRDKYC